MKKEFVEKVHQFPKWIMTKTTVVSPMIEINFYV